MEKLKTYHCMRDSYLTVNLVYLNQPPGLTKEVLKQAVDVALDRIKRCEESYGSCLGLCSNRNLAAINVEKFMNELQ